MAFNLTLTCDKCGKELFKKNLDDERPLRNDELDYFDIDDDIREGLATYIESQVSVNDKFIAHLCAECSSDINLLLFNDGSVLPIPNENDIPKEAIEALSKEMNHG